MTTEPVSHEAKDDKELADALAGINGATSGPVAKDALSFEETPSPNGAVVGSPFDDATPSESAAAPANNHAATHTSSLPVPSVSGDTFSVENPALEGIKKDALNELRPLVDKLNVSAEEKFDTYLLLLRSTDDTTLIAPAHEAAKEISDEARRAQALLDVIKEIDYLSQSK